MWYFFLFAQKTFAFLSFSRIAKKHINRTVLSEIILHKASLLFDNIFETSVDDPHSYVVTDLVDNEV